MCRGTLMCCPVFLPIFYEPHAVQVLSITYSKDVPLLNCPTVWFVTTALMRNKRNFLPNIPKSNHHRFPTYRVSISQKLWSLLTINFCIKALKINYTHVVWKEIIEFIFMSRHISRIFIAYMSIHTKDLSHLSTMAMIGKKYFRSSLFAFLFN
jgi:hypothetical protein